MLQYQEEKKEGVEPLYSLQWSSDIIDSSRFVVGVLNSLLIPKLLCSLSFHKLVYELVSI